MQLGSPSLAEKPEGPVPLGLLSLAETPEGAVPPGSPSLVEIGLVEPSEKSAEWSAEPSAERSAVVAEVGLAPV